MKIHDIKDEEGRIFAFEVNNLFFTRKGLCRFIRSIPEVKILKAPGFRSFFKGEDEFCEFEIQGHKFVAWEPWNDNSCYWIGPNPPNWCEQVEIVRNAFANHKLFSFLRK
ncbi:MAG: hypothetical protein ACREFE_14740 [Limisphaerales bacterium]